MPHNRPRLRLTPDRNWMNDPNGLIFWQGMYHAFYQHHPDCLTGGPKHWGHAVSRDGLTWQRQPIALYPCALGEIYSGSAVEDVRNTAGFGAGALVCVFTLHGDAETQGIAHSNDGVHFTMYDRNPVLDNPGIVDFRDPRVFWYAPEQRWSMVVAAGDSLRFYRSEDLKQWTQTGVFSPADNPVPGIWECPDLFPLDGPDGRTHWVLIGSMIPRPARPPGAYTQVLIGQYDGETFRVTQREEGPVWLDGGMDNYAAITFSGLPDSERTLMGWMANWQYAGKMPQDGYRGQMTLPRRLRLCDAGGKLRLAQALTPALLRRFDAPAPVAGPMALQLPCLIALDAQGACEAVLESEAGEALRIGVDGENRLYVDRTQARKEPLDPMFETVRQVPRIGSQGDPILIAVDGGGVEVFADGGLTALTMLALPSAPWRRLGLTGQASAHVRFLR